MEKQYKHSLFWFRRDLRFRDNIALTKAMQSSETVTAVFVFDTNILDKLKDRNDRRVIYIQRSLQEVDSFLQKMHSKLVVLHGDPSTLIPKIAKSLSVDAVFANMDIEPYAKQRDQVVKESLAKQDQVLSLSKDHVIFAKDEILNGQGLPYKVFTPYKNKWLEMFDPSMSRDATYQHYNFTDYKTLKPYLKPWRLQDIGFVDNELFVDAGQEAAQLRLKMFQKILKDYKKNRDFPGISQGTSMLSTCLRFGTISIRECVRLARSIEGEGALTWLSELIWRDFYHMILDRFPEVIDEPFNKKYTKLIWPGTKAHFKKWCEGQTGYPLVDAAMRCLNQTGLMHNRLRMIVAMFLTKDLLVDYKWGEAYFAQKLQDFDLAANNGGWQWSASTGCDAQPYFRIFNPTTQSQKFDAEGVFIRQYCPELHGFDNKKIHEPSKATLMEQQMAGCIMGKDYPHPIVDHKVQREIAIAMFKDQK